MAGDNIELHKLYVQWLIQYHVRQFPEDRRPVVGSQHEYNIAKKYAREGWYYTEFVSWYSSRHKGKGLESLGEALPPTIEAVDHGDRYLWDVAREEARRLVDKLTYGELVYWLTGRLRFDDAETSAVAEKIAVLLGVEIVNGEVVLPKGIDPTDFVAFRSANSAACQQSPNTLVDKVVRSMLSSYVGKVRYVEVLADLRSSLRSSIPVMHKVGRTVAVAIGLEVRGNTVQLPPQIDPLATVAIVRPPEATVSLPEPEAELEI